MSAPSSVPAPRHVDTIVAVASAPGRAAVALLRLSGAEATTIADAVLRHGARRTGELDDRRATLARLVDGRDGRSLDTVLVTRFAAPRSYTGEELVEIGLHGNPLIVAEAIRQLTAAGARLARPGEFTRRAFANGRMDLTRAEAVLDVVAAESLEAVKLAQRRLRGDLSARYDTLKAIVADALGGIEATLEFPDDLEENSARALERAAGELGRARELTADLIASAARGARAQHGASVALIGRPNVGKSSIFNRLCGFDRAIVTPVAGTTRDLLDATVEIGGGVSVRVVDTAGLTETADPVELEGVDRARGALESADLVLWVLDASRALEEAERRLAGELQGRPVWRLVNKIDLGDVRSGADLASTPAATWPELRVSARSGAGFDELVERLVAELGAGDHEDAPVASERQRLELEELAARLGRACTELSGGAEELAAEELRGGLEVLGRIVGRVSDDEVLDRIFSKFCIGK